VLKISDTRLLTPADVGLQSGLSLKTVYRAIERGDLHASKICSRLRMRQSDVDAWVERGSLNPSAGTARSIRAAHHPSPNGLRAMLATRGETGIR
jgi:excisionase family DNA binding protein